MFSSCCGCCTIYGNRDIVSFYPASYAAQKAVLELDISQPGPLLFILEDVTGAGKTEAALILTHRLMSAGKAQGLFFGLPTMATANAMFDRLAQSWLALYQSDAPQPGAGAQRSRVDGGL